MDSFEFPCMECDSSENVVITQEKNGTRSAKCSCRNRKWCADCGLMWTSLHNCELAMEMLRQRDARLISLEFEENIEPLGFKRCPECRHGCEKSDPDSCDHIHCECGAEFCWSCLADRKVIYHHGNHYHMPDCRFFFEYNGKVEFKEKCPKCVKTGRPCQPPKLEVGPVLFKRNRRNVSKVA